MPDSTDISIHADRLGKRYGRVTAVDNLSFEIRRGEIVGFLGPNGAGKSTTLRILTGILPASSGSLTVCGIPLASDDGSVRSRIGYMPENNPLPDDLRVIEYLRFRARIKGIPMRHQRAFVEHAMEVCELNRKARRKLIGTLSKGFRQRVGIADAILAKPEVTILDEPTIGLDPHQVIAIRKLLDQLRGETTVIFSSHILSEVEISCDKVLILNQGRLVAAGTAAELREEFLPGERFSIELSGDPQLLVTALRDNDPAWQIEPLQTLAEDRSRLCCHLPRNGIDAAELLQQLQRQPNVRIHAFHKQEAGLEEIFLTATRRSWELTDSNPTVEEATVA
jgi:ABC-2 type transport system ATP-binding protein